MRDDTSTETSLPMILTSTRSSKLEPYQVSSSRFKSVKVILSQVQVTLNLLSHVWWNVLQSSFLMFRHPRNPEFFNLSLQPFLGRLKNLFFVKKTF